MEGNNGQSGCDPCHGAFDGTTDGAVPPEHGFVTTSWTLQTVAGDAVAAGCSACHGYPPLAAGDPNAGQYADGSLEDYNFAGGAHGVNAHVPFGSVEGDAWGPCAMCHTNNTAHVMTTPVSGNRGNVTLSVDAAYRLIAANPTVYNGDPLVDAEFKTCDNISCHYGLTPDWAMRAQVAPGTLTVTSPGALPAAGSVGPGVSDFIVDRIQFSAAGGPVTVTSIKVQETGSAVNATDIAALKFYPRRQHGRQPGPPRGPPSAPAPTPPGIPATRRR